MFKKCYQTVDVYNEVYCTAQGTIFNININCFLPPLCKTVGEPGKKRLLTGVQTKLINSLKSTELREGGAEKAMATHSSTLAWKIPWMEEPGGLQSMGSQRVGHN